MGLGEEDIVGPFVFTRANLNSRAMVPNRILVPEYCGTHHLMFANTFSDYPDEFLVYYNLVVRYTLLQVVFCLS